MLSAALLLTFGPEPAFLKNPDVHGNSMVFSCEGDIWLGDLTSGKAVRLTKDEGLEDAPVFSPDGTQIAFHGEYDGIRGAYVMPTEGGPPRRVSYATQFRSVTGWTPDGQAVLCRSLGTPTSYEQWTAPVGPGAFKKLPLEFSSHVWFGPTSDQYCFTRFNRWATAWFNYIGGLQNQVWVANGNSFKAITSLKGTCEFPVWCGDTIYFAHEEERKFRLMSVPASGGKAQTVAGPYDFEIRELSTDRKRVVYEVGNELEIYDPETGKTSLPTFALNSDKAHTRPYLVDGAAYADGAALSPSAKRVLVSTRGQIVSLPVGEGEARVWKAQPGNRLQLPELSPDGKSVAYVSDQTGEHQIFVAAADGSGARQVTKTSPAQIKSTFFSPDSKWIVFYTSDMSLRIVDVATGNEREIGRFSGSWQGPTPSFSPDSKWVAFARNRVNTTVDQIELFNVEDGTVRLVSDGRSDDMSPSFSKDGKFLVFLSRRQFDVVNDPVLNQLNNTATVIPCVLPLSADQPSPFVLKDPSEDEAKPAEPGDKKDEATRIDFDGLYERRVEVPAGAKAYTQVAMVKDRILMAADGQVTFYDYTAKRSGTLTTGGGFSLNKDGSKMLLSAGQGQWRVVDTGGTDVPATAGVVSWGGLKLQVVPLAEWKQMFWDSWRLLRDYFYVANMHGLDWKAIGAKYAAMLPAVRSRSELDDLIRWMQSELGSSHQYRSPGDQRDIKPRITPGFLGVDLEGGPGRKLRIAKVLRGDGFRASERSPLADPALKIKEGMYLLKVGGQEVDSQIEVFDQLLGRVGQVVSVTVNDQPTLEKARTVFVRPVANEGRMRYLDWVESNRRYVDKASGGKVGYLHLAAMGNNDMDDFVKQYFPQRDKLALIVDDRFNNGGYIQSIVNNILSVKVSGYFNMRNSRESWTRQSEAFIGHMACLMNEFSISCGEEFPHRFKDLGLGPLIGRRTEGGEVGSSPGWPLLDGGQVNVPNYGMYTAKDGWVIEGAGVSPDIDVPSDPNAYVAGRDPQLDAAVKAMLDAIKKKPVVWPQPPKDHDRTRGN